MSWSSGILKKKENICHPVYLNFNFCYVYFLLPALNGADHRSLVFYMDEIHNRMHHFKDTHSWHTRKGSSSEEGVRENLVFVYQRQGCASVLEEGGKSDSLLSPTKTCFDASIAAATRLSLAIFFNSQCVCVCVHLSGALRRPGVEAGHKKELPKKIREDST